jgi:hypothetical protein
VIGKEASQAGPERAGSLDRERAPPRRMLFCNPQGLRGSRGCLRSRVSRTPPPAAHLDHPDRVRVTVRINTNDEVQFVCKHP